MIDCDKDLKFCFEKSSVVGRVEQAKSSDPATPSKFGTCTWGEGQILPPLTRLFLFVQA